MLGRMIQLTFKARLVLLTATSASSFQSSFPALYQMLGDMIIKTRKFNQKNSSILKITLLCPYLVQKKKKIAVILKHASIL